MSHYAPGEVVELTVSVMGIRTSEARTVLTTDARGVWLDNGPGNRPSGPYNPDTGYRADGALILGSTQRICKMI